MKKLILILAFLFLLVGCSNDSRNEEALKLSISSPNENLIQDVSTFRLDSIWLTVSYENYEEQVIANKSMLSKNDLNALKTTGEHEITFNYKNLSVKADIILYDINSIGDNKYYIINVLGEDYLYYGVSPYDYELPIACDLYFYNYVLSDDQNYFDDGNKVYSVYAKFSNVKTYKVRFIFNDIVIYEEYVKEGESANPPKMKTYEGYVFAGFIGDYTNITCDTDIYLSYEKGYEVIFYNFDNSILDRQIVSLYQQAQAPLLDSNNYYIFLGWSEDFTNVTKNLEIYPIYRKNEGIVVNYYRDYISSDTKLKTVVYENNEEITFDYEIYNYYIYSYSIDLNSITQSCDVIVFYQPILYRYYFDDTNYIEQPFYYDEPVILGKKWNLVSENTYVLVNKTNFDNIQLITNKHGEEIVEYDDFVSNDIEMYYALKNNAYEIYRWYSDDTYLNEISIDSTIPDVLYGRLLDESEYLDKRLDFDSYSKLNFDGCMVGIKDYNYYDYCVIPSMYKGMEVTIINSNIFSYFKKVFISRSIVDVYDDTRSKDPITEYFIISNYNDNIYYDDGLYVKTNRGLVFAGISKLYSSNKLEINCDIINPNAMPCLTINTIKLNATTAIDIFGSGIFATNIILSDRVKSFINRIYHLYGVISFESACNIEMFSMRLWVDNYGKELPQSVKYLDTFDFYPYKEVELLVPRNHKYFKFINDILVDSNNTAIATRYLDQNKARSYVVDSSISQFYAGFLQNCSINTITFNNDVNITTLQNGIKKPTDPEGYFRFPTIFVNMHCNKVIMNGNHHFNINKESQLFLIKGYDGFKSTDNALIIGNQLLALRGITGDYTIRKDVIIDMVYVYTDCTINNLYIPKNSVLINNEIVFYDSNSIPKINVIYY